MTPSHAKSLADAVQARRDDAIALLGEMVPLARDPEALADLFAARLAALGCEVEDVRYEPASVPLVAEFASREAATGEPARLVLGRLPAPAGASGRSLLLFAHPDTEIVRHAERWTSDPFAMRIADGRIIGWGVADDLGGLAMMLEALAALEAAGLRPTGDVTLASAPSKRHARGIGAALHRGLDADAAVYCHPAESGHGLDEIKAFAPGLLEFEVVVRGRPPETSEPSHAAFAHLAVHPLDKAMPILAALKAYGDERGRSVHHPRLDAAVGRSANLMVTQFHYGTPDTRTAIAPDCRFAASLTLVPEEDLDAIKTEVEATIEKVASADPWFVDTPPQVTWLAGVSAAETPDDAAIYRTADQVLRTLGASPRVNPLHTSSDIRNPIVQRGMPTIGFGPRCGQLVMAGGHDEWLDADDYARAILATALIVAEWCGVTRI